MKPIKSDRPPKSKANYSRLHQLSVVLAVVSFTAVLLLSIFEGSLISIVLFLLSGLSGFVFSKHRFGRIGASIFLTGFSTSAIVVVAMFCFLLNQYGNPYYNGGRSDDVSYERDAEIVARRLAFVDYQQIRGGVVHERHNSVGYIFFLSMLYRTVGPDNYHTLFPRILNCVAVGLLGLFSYDLARKYGLPDSIACRAGLTVGLFPLISYNSAFVFRDVLISIAILVVVNLWTTNKNQPFSTTQISKNWIKTLIISVAIYEFREEHGLVVLGVGMVGMLFSTRLGVGKSRWFFWGIAVIGLVCSMYVASDIVMKKSNDLAQAQERYMEYRVASTSGLSNYVFKAKGPIMIPLRIAYAMVSPLPQFLPADRFWMSIGTVPQILFLPYTFFGFYYCSKRPQFIPMIFTFSALFCGVAFFTFQYRQMVQYLPYAIVATYVGVCNMRMGRKEVLSISIGILAILVAAYVILKWT